MGEIANTDPKLREKEAEAEVEIWKCVFGFTSMAVVKCAIQLGIAEAIETHQGPITISDLSSTLKCSPSSLHRIMRFLVHHNFFREEPTTHGTTGYVQTALSRRLVRQGEHSMADLILMESSPPMLRSWYALSSKVLEDGKSSFEEANGQDVWKYAEENLDHSKLINNAMACDSRVSVPAMIKGCPEVFDTSIETLVDVGGGNGITLSLLVKAFPWIKGINFDVPHVVSFAPEYPGVKHVSGDMFKRIPKADAVMMKWTLHDWNDEDCIKILRNCKEAIPKEKGKVIIIDVVVGERRDDEYGNKLEFVRLMLDMAMMAHTHTGKERTSKEWDFVLKQAGFNRYNIKSIPAVQSVIEAFP